MNNELDMQLRIAAARIIIHCVHPWSATSMSKCLYYRNILKQLLRINQNSVIKNIDSLVRNSQHVYLQKNYYLTRALYLYFTIFVESCTCILFHITWYFTVKVNTCFIYNSDVTSAFQIQILHDQCYTRPIKHF